jgi:hypothetical protein
MTTLADSRVASALDRMYTESNDQMSTLRERFDGFDMSSKTPQERADALSDVYMPVTPEAGRLLYALVRATRAPPRSRRRRRTSATPGSAT